MGLVGRLRKVTLGKMSLIFSFEISNSKKVSKRDILYVKNATRKAVKVFSLESMFKAMSTCLGLENTFRTITQKCTFLTLLDL